MQTIAVLLTVFNRKDKTLECLKRLYNQLPLDGYHVDVYLTNDGCTDGTPEAVATQYPEVDIINGNGNLYWNRGMYTAWHEAAKKNYDFYLWLNDDTFVYNDFLLSLISASKTKNNKAIIVGATKSKINNNPTYGGRIKGKGVSKPNNSIVKVDYFNGNIVLVPRYVYNILGNLDYYFTHSKGDFDYGFRANKNGIEMYQVGSFLGECELHETLDKWCNPDIPFKQRWKMLYRPNGMPPKETYYFDRRHKGLFTAIFHYCTVHIRCLIPNLWKNEVEINK